MKHHILATALAAVISIFSTAAMAGNPFSYKGTTDTKVMGKEEIQDNLVLNLSETEAGLAASLEGFEILGYKNISITGIITVDENGTITGWDKIVIKGAPAKVKKIEGRLGKTGADIRMTGRAGGMFPFDIHYTAKRL